MEKQNNFAFIDGNNLILGLRNQFWNLDFKKFRIFLKDKYRVTKAFWFIGKIAENENLYEAIKNAGFEIIFKETVKDKNGKIKGNVDVLLTVQSFEEIENFDGIVLVSGDGDFVDLLKAMEKRGKRIKVLIPNEKFFPKLFLTFRTNCLFLSRDNIRNKIGQKNG